MPVLTIQGTWYGSGCAEFNGVYADLGTVSHTNYSLVQTGTGLCTGFNFIVVDNTDGSTFYTSTSPGKDLSLFFDGSPSSVNCNCWGLYANTQSGGTAYTRYFCAQSARFSPSEVAPAGSGGVKILYVSCNDGTERSLFLDVLGIESWVYPTSQLVNGGGQEPTLQGSKFGSCDGCLSSRYNCLNGLCVEAEDGAYENLQACELVCGVNPDGLVCLTPQEWAEVQNKINQIKAKSCD